MKSYSNFCVDTDILRKNAENIKKLIGNGTKFCAVVKANAYGAGLYTVCSALNGIADYFACACLKEALQIRVFDKITNVLILGVTNTCDIDMVARENITISVGSLEYLERLASIAKSRINIHIQVNTGLNRFGFKSITEFKKALKIIDKNKNIVLTGVYTHFATKQNDIAFINKQYLRFQQFKKCVKDKSVLFHVSNSFATLHNSSFNMGMIRCGFLLYGYADNKIGNMPIVSITSQIVHLSTIKKGDTVGYDRTFTADRAMKIAVVPLGYADGINRKLSNNFSVLISGTRCKILGLICMDVFMVDVTHVSNVQVGSKVTILGSDGDKKITISDMANCVGTSPYEIICAFKYNRMNYIVKSDNKNT